MRSLIGPVETLHLNGHFPWFMSIFRFFYGFPVVFPGFPYGYPRVSPWFSHGFHLRLPAGGGGEGLVERQRRCEQGGPMGKTRPFEGETWEIGNFMG